MINRRTVVALLGATLVISTILFPYTTYWIVERDVAKGAIQSSGPHAKLMPLWEAWPASQRTRDQAFAERGARTIYAAKIEWGAVAVTAVLAALFVGRMYLRRSPVAATPAPPRKNKGKRK
jgi:hypothetical protein